MELEQLGISATAPRWRVWLVVSAVVAAMMVGLAVYVVLQKIGDSDARMVCRARYADKVVSAQVDGQISQGFLLDAIARGDQPGIARFLKENIDSILRLDAARIERLGYGSTQSLPCPIGPDDVFVPPPISAPTPSG